MQPVMKASLLWRLFCCIVASGVQGSEDSYEETPSEDETTLLATSTWQQHEIARLQDEVRHWKSKYEGLLELFADFSSQPQTIQDLPVDRTHFMPGNVQHCRNAIASRTPAQATNPQQEPDVRFPNYSYVVYGQDSQFAHDLQQSYDGASDSLEKFLIISPDVRNPAIMFDIDNTLAYTGFNDTDLVGKAPALTAAVDFVNRWCAFEDSDSPFECFFFTARYCTSLKAAATKIWVADNFPVSHEWIDKHVFMTGGVGGCDSGGCSLAYKAALRNWFTERQDVFWVMSIGDQFTDSAGVASGLRVKLPNFWFDSSVVPNPLGNGGKVHLDDHGTFPPGNEHCELNCVVGPDDACLEASLKDDAIYWYTRLQYCLDQDRAKSPDQVHGCKYNLLTGEVTC